MEDHRNVHAFDIRLTVIGFGFGSKRAICLRYCFPFATKQDNGIVKKNVKFPESSLATRFLSKFVFRRKLSQIIERKNSVCAFGFDR